MIGQRSNYIRKALKVHAVTMNQKHWEVRIQADELQVSGRAVPRGQCRYNILNPDRRVGNSAVG